MVLQGQAKTLHELSAVHVQSEGEAMVIKHDKHVQLMKPVVEHYKKLGYRCAIVHRPTPDFLAIDKERKIIAVEVNAYGTNFDFKKYQDRSNLDVDIIHWIVVNSSGDFEQIYPSPNGKFEKVHLLRPTCPWCGKLLKYKESMKAWKCFPCGRDLITQQRREHRKNVLERSKPA